MIRIVLVLGLLTCTLAVKTLTKVVVDEPDAFCLDGSKPAYYVNQGLKNKFVLSFEGGGWCGSHLGISQTLEDCYQRSKTALGSSLSYPAILNLGQGLLSDNAQNPFKDWTMIHMKYCDGTGHQGYKKDPISYKDSKLYFRGLNSTLAKLNSIDKNFKVFSVATDIIITGQSAGGLATFVWSEYIASRAPKGAYVWSVPDSGIFLDELNFNTKTFTYRQLFQNFMSISNQEVDPPNTECVISNPSAKWKCMFAQYNHNFINIPLFPIQSLYDSWSLPNILGIGCGSGGSLANCNQSQLEYINEYRLNTTFYLKEITHSSDKNGCWAPACSDHVYSVGTAFYSPSFRIPAGSSFSLSYCLDTWMWATSGSTKKCDVENCQWMDSEPWPSNKPCSGVKELRMQ